MPPFYYMWILRRPLVPQPQPGRVIAVQQQLIGTQRKENWSEGREKRVEQLRESIYQMLCLGHMYIIPFNPQSN